MPESAPHTWKRSFELGLTSSLLCMFVWPCFQKACSAHNGQPGISYEGVSSFFGPGTYLAWLLCAIDALWDIELHDLIKFYRYYPNPANGPYRTFGSLDNGTWAALSFPIVTFIYTAYVALAKKESILPHMQVLRTACGGFLGVSTVALLPSLLYGTPTETGNEPQNHLPGIPNYYQRRPINKRTALWSIVWLFSVLLPVLADLSPYVDMPVLYIMMIISCLLSLGIIVLSFTDINKLQIPSWLFGCKLDAEVTRLFSLLIIWTVQLHVMFTFQYGSGYACGYTIGYQCGHHCGLASLNSDSTRAYCEKNIRVQEGFIRPPWPPSQTKLSELDQAAALAVAVVWLFGSHLKHFGSSAWRWLGDAIR